jgi:hypothetical protein
MFSYFVTDRMIKSQIIDVESEQFVIKSMIESFWDRTITDTSSKDYTL